MKYTITIPEMLFNKIIKDERRIDIHLLTKQYQKIKLHDIIEYKTSNSQSVLRHVRGLGFFENIYDLAASVPPEMFGYNNPEEIIVRFNRQHSKEQQKDFNILALFIDEVHPIVSEQIRDAKTRL